MVRVVRNTLLQYIPLSFNTEDKINPNRIFSINNKEIKGDCVIYLCEREIRAKDNFALQFGLEKSSEINLPFKIVHPKISFEYQPKQKFINEQILKSKQVFLKNNIDFEIFEGSFENLLNYLKSLNTALLIIDFNPILNRTWLSKASFKILEIDSHNIIPSRFLSNKKEYAASTLRPKIYHNIYPYLNEYKPIINYNSEADLILKDFIKNKLPYYNEFRNNPNKDVLSNLSPYISNGFISSQRIALEVIKSDVPEINKEAFLEELIIRKELAENFCLYCKNFKSLNCIPYWAKTSLTNHHYDLRSYTYTQEELENADTHDRLWNAAQIQLIKEGKIHSYLRMYWAKKILEWTLFPQTALEIAIYLNDKYGYDAPSPNGYTGILWAIGGLHDRAFRDFPVTGKIRRMTYNSLKTKFDTESYIKKYS